MDMVSDRKLAKAEFEILNKRVISLEKKLNEIKQSKPSKKTKRAK